jgi:hypothetical protein
MGTVVEVFDGGIVSAGEGGGFTDVDVSVDVLVVVIVEEILSFVRSSRSEKSREWIDRYKGEKMGRRGEIPGLRG